jgi:hypothetical protein
VIRFTGTVYYADGSTEEFSAGIPAQMAWERYAQRNGYPFAGDGAPPALSNLVIAHAGVRSADSFEKWLERVDNADVKAEDVNPTAPAPEAG